MARNKRRQSKAAKSAGGGSLSRMRGGIKGLVGAGPKRKQGVLGRVLNYLLIAAAIGIIAYRLWR